MLDDIFKEVSESLGIPEDTVSKVYKAYWKTIKDYIESLPLKDNLTEEEFLSLRPNINIPSIGKLYVTYDSYKYLKKYYNENYKDKEDTTNI